MYVRGFCFLFSSLHLKALIVVKLFILTGITSQMLELRYKMFFLPLYHEIYCELYSTLFNSRIGGWGEDWLVILGLWDFCTLILLNYDPRPHFRIFLGISTPFLIITPLFIFANHTFQKGRLSKQNCNTW